MTAQFHDKVARTWLKEHSIEVPGGLNYLKIDSKAGQEYLQVIYPFTLWEKKKSHKFLCRNPPPTLARHRRTILPMVLRPVAASTNALLCQKGVVYYHMQRL